MKSIITSVFFVPSVFVISEAFFITIAYLWSTISKTHLFLYCYVLIGGNGKVETVGLLHIQDAVVAIGAALERGHIGEVYNIGGQCDCSPNFIELIAKVYFRFHGKYG